MTRQKPVLAWHWVTEDRRLRDGRPVEVGRLYRLSPDLRPVLCNLGFHASLRAFDALAYAPGPVICRVHLTGEVLYGEDKCVASRRRVLWMADATRVLHEFMCDAATASMDRLEALGEVIDPRNRAAIATKRAWLRGEVTDEQLAAVWDASVSPTRWAVRVALSVGVAAARTASPWDAYSVAAVQAGQRSLAALGEDLERRLLALAPAEGSAAE